MWVFKSQPASPLTWTLFPEYLLDEAVPWHSLYLLTLVPDPGKGEEPGDQAPAPYCLRISSQEGDQVSVAGNTPEAFRAAPPGLVC